MIGEVKFALTKVFDDFLRGKIDKNSVIRNRFYVIPSDRLHSVMKIGDTKVLARIGNKYDSYMFFLITMNSDIHAGLEVIVNVKKDHKGHISVDLNSATGKPEKISTKTLAGGDMTLVVGVSDGRPSTLH